jgi:hypothetical protein
VIIGEAGRAAQAVWGDAPTEPGRVYGGGAGGSGRFELSPDELASVIGLWQDELDKITEDGRKIELVIRSLRAPGGDTASGGYVSTGMDSLSALQSQNDSMKTYVQDYIKKLNLAKSGTVATDEAVADALKRAK